ncbi:hypothetical protein DPMN_098204 [Dreissena polymorpha]|uniref:Uncharacterized protein n=1 Tax=Dreissena polymorpha TaxID=45954 RepID=A0A9D4LD59_DREPO|nr:hypothetical protein DPMN_098204 [Dreissena polymorpha]
MSEFHEDWAKNVSSRLFTCFYYVHIQKTAPPPRCHVFPLITTIFKLVRDIHITNAKMKNTPTRRPWFFVPIQTIFELNCRIQETNVLTKVHEDWAKMCLLDCSHRKLPPGGLVFPPIMTFFKLKKNYDDYANNVTSRVGHDFSPIRTIFELVRDINETNVLTKFHDDLAIIVTSRVFTRNTSPPPGGHVVQWTGTIFQLNQNII